MNQETTEAVFARLARVEAQYRRLRAAAALSAILCVLLLVMGQQRSDAQTVSPRRGDPPFTLPTGPVPQTPVEEHIRARHISLVDEKGNERAAMAADAAGSVFVVLFDRNGKARANMQVSNLGPSINFYDASGRSRAILGSTNIVTSHVASPTGDVERQPASSIVLFDKDGKLLWRTP